MSEKNEELFRTIFRSANEFIHILDPSGRILKTNPYTIKTLGYSENELIGEPLTKFLSPGTKKKFTESFSSLMEKGEIRHEVELVCKNGRIITVDCQATVILNTEGNITSIAVFERDITERKKTEATLKKSEEKYRILFENSEVGMYRSKLDGTGVLAVNQKISDILEIPTEEILSNPAFIRYEDPAERETMIAKLIEDGFIRDYEVRIKAGNGEVKTLLISGNVSYKQGWFEGSIIDITERKRIEKELREREEKLKNIIENVDDWIWEVNERGTYTFVSPQIKNILGFDPDEIIGKTPFDLMPEEEGNKISKIFGKFASKKNAFSNLENTNIHKNGTLVVLETSGTPIMDEKGNLLGYRGIDRDITERKKAEEKVRKMSQAVEQSPATVVITDTKGDIEYVNPKFSQLTGYTAEEAMGENPRILKSGSQSEEFYRELWETITAGKEWRGEIHNKKKNGELFWEHASISPIIDEKGETTHFIAIKEDVTERKALEKELKEYADHLEDEVKKQANELIQSEKMASIGLLVAGIAHEVNNPLAYLKSNSNFLKQDFSELEKMLKERNIEIDFEEFEEIIDTNIEGLERISKITKALKRFARPDTGGRAFVNINEGIKDTLIMVDNQLKYRIEVHEDYGEIPMLDCNIGQLNQVFMNLIINASQAMDKGDMWIKTWSDNSYIFIRIRDNGAGIPPDRINSIFDPFYTSKESGTGLGLSISYRIIQDHNGEIIVESEVGKGTSMTIKLPVEE